MGCPQLDLSFGVIAHGTDPCRQFSKQVAGHRASSPDSTNSALTRLVLARFARASVRTLRATPAWNGTPRRVPKRDR